jgi:hypothetical protein
LERKALALTLLLVLLVSALVGAKLANQAEANPSPSSADSIIRIESPENKTYRTNIITLSVTSEHTAIWSPIVDDAAAWAYLGIDERPSLNLSDGSHTLIASAYHLGSACVTFTIDTAPPNVSVASPQNITYYTFAVPLNFTVNEPVSQIAYSLDGEDNVTVTGNTTLNVLFPGEYNVTVYAQDAVGNVGASETIYFNTAKKPEPESYPTTIVIATIAAVAVISVGLLVYFKKRNH